VKRAAVAALLHLIAHSEGKKEKAKFRLYTSSMDRQPIYRQVLRNEFDRLAPELKSFHGVCGSARFRGKCRIESATSPIGRFLCWLLDLPKAANDAEFVFELDASATDETWRRHFPDRTMRSTMQVADGLLVERIGPVRLWFVLSVESGRLVMRLARFSVFGLPWPSALMPEVWGDERGSAGVLHFDVGARLPAIGLLASYNGSLVIDP